MMRDALKLLSVCAAVAAVAAAGAWVTAPEVGTWYALLIKPALTPPGWVFGPVWSALYALMAAAAWLVWRRAGWGRALGLWALQLALNALWSLAFFGFENIALGLAVIAALWLAVAAATAAFAAHSRAAAALMLPYLAWVSFAAYLNLMLLVLNRP